MVTLYELDLFVIRWKDEFQAKFMEISVIFMDFCNFYDIILIVIISYRSGNYYTPEVKTKKVCVAYWLKK